MIRRKNTPLRIKLKPSVWLVLILLVAAGVPAACDIQPTSSETKGPTVISVTPAASPTPAQTETTTGTTARPVHHELLSIKDYGTFANGHTLLLPDGYWYDTADDHQITQISDLTVTTDGPGRPTLSRQDDQTSILTITNCSNITFRNIRFGFDQAEWPDQTEPDDSALIKLIQSDHIRFENCEFFSSSGAAVLLDASDNIFFDNCLFYNIVDAPFKTGHAYVPSRIDCSDCTFETVTSGVLPLNLHHSLFERCTWIGRKGYRVPVPAMNKTEGERVADDPDHLPVQLAGTLAAKIRYRIDDAQRLTLVNNIFSSDEVFVLFEQMEAKASELLPEKTLDWSLSGQKIEELQSGETLDPTLGINLSLRTQIDEETIVVESDSGQESIRQPRYTLSELLQDLTVIQDLAQRLNPLITGTVSVKMSDQNRHPLLQLEIPVESLESWINPDSPNTIIAQSNLVLLHPDLNPALFMENERFGRFSASHFISVLESSFSISEKPLIVYPDDEPYLLTYQIRFTGSHIQDSVVYHTYQLLLERSGTQDEAAGPVQNRFKLAEFSIRADNGVKRLTSQPDQSGQIFQLINEDQRAIIWPLLQNPIVLDEQTELNPLSLWAADASDMTPVFVMSDHPDRIVFRVIYFDDHLYPVPIEIVILRSDDQWEIDSVLKLAK